MSLPVIHPFEVGHNMQLNEEEEACATISVCRQNWFVTGMQVKLKIKGGLIHRDVLK